MGLFSGAGSFLNDFTGATSAGKQSQKYALQSAVVNNKYQKEFAQNAHQWEIADLKKAGLNPVLSAGGSGATASGGGVASASETSAGYSPLDILNMGATAFKTMQEGKNIGADTLNKGVQNQLLKIDLMIRSGAADADIKKAFQELANMQAMEKNVIQDTDTKKSEAEFNRRRASGKSRTYSANAHGGISMKGAEGGISGTYSVTE